MNLFDPPESAPARVRGREFTPRHDTRIIMPADTLEALVAQRLYDLASHLIDLIDVTTPTTPDPAVLLRVAERLGAFGYQPVVVPDDDPHRPALRLASPRLVTPQVDLFQDAAGRAALLARHGVRCRGVIQVGAHVGQQVPIFQALGASRIALVEANPEVYRTLRDNVAAMGVQALMANCAITDFDGETELLLNSFDQSSSLLPLGHHAVEYPSIRPVGKVRVPARRLDTLITREFGVDPADFNVLEIDVQGAEGLVLRGGAGQLAHVDAVFVEINYRPMYEGCLLVDAIDTLMLDAGLMRVATHCAHSLNWGDALYVRMPRTVTMSSLGRNGRLGNQIFQYAWLATLCAEHGLLPQAPSGDLSRLFDVNPPWPADAASPAEPTESAAPLPEQALLTIDPFSSQTAVCARGRDVGGYFQFHTALWFGRERQFRQRLPLTATSRLLQRLIRESFERRGRALAMHYRQGDFEQFRDSPVFFTAPLDWYANAARELTGGPRAGFVYLASDGPLDIQPLLAVGLTVLRARELTHELQRSPEWRARPDRDALIDPMVVDFLALQVADALLISNSTFSFAAAMLNEHGRLFMRPDREAGRLRPFDPWHDEVLLGLQHEAIRFARR